MKIVIASDSFKGSLTAWEVGTIVKQAVHKVFPTATVEVVPMADGGEGTVEAIVQAASGSVIDVTVTGPLGHPVAARYGTMGPGPAPGVATVARSEPAGAGVPTAIVEVASVAGLPMVPAEQRNPERTTTYGLGEVLRHALDAGYRRFIVGLGGSATNDGGIGLLQALGAVFLDASGRPVPPVGGALSDIAEVRLDTLDKRVWESEIQVACDVDNPLCGERGASAIFGPQKGATPEQVQRLDAGLMNLATRIQAVTESHLHEVPGAGAAGGLGFAFLLLGAHLVPGAKLVGDAVGLEEKMQGADFAFTGEGQSDYQTLFGKVPFYVAQVAAKHGAKAILLSGGLGHGVEALYDHFVSLHSIVSRPMTLAEAMEEAEPLLFGAAENIARLLRVNVRAN
ncbi:MAG: glycerate kinase [Alicyclobacillus sp.]|nr:glycerate kinase [Alicyclobacillus sp.]